ncbi:hypothetical protein [Streptomyces erythrochromogenes]|uniref:hypothetical protein n=1 Tax=Streptomyces erythrochromogenes TaxID=285574 RepID=UPI003442C3E2
MAETIYVRGEGGAIIAMDLPLPEGIAERYERGQLPRVHSDGSPYTPPAPRAPAPTPQAPGPGGDGPPDPDPGTGTEPAAPPTAPPAAPRGADRPAVNAPKAEWIAYVVASGLHSAEDAANYTKADLIDMVS